MNQNKKMKRGAIYLRVANEQVSDEKLSIKSQESACRAFCESQGIVVDNLDIYTDIAGGTCQDREGLSLLMSAAKRSEFETVVVYKIDRLSRNLRHLLNIVNELPEVRSVSESLNVNTPSGKMLLNMLGMFSEFEREVIRARGKLEGCCNASGCHCNC